MQCQQKLVHLRHCHSNELQFSAVILLPWPLLLNLKVTQILQDICEFLKLNTQYIRGKYFRSNHCYIKIHNLNLFSEIWDFFNVMQAIERGYIILVITCSSTLLCGLNVIVIFYQIWMYLGLISTYASLSQWILRAILFFPEFLRLISSMIFPLC